MEYWFLIGFVIYLFVGAKFTYVDVVSTINDDTISISVTIALVLTWLALVFITIMIWPFVLMGVIDNWMTKSGFDK